MSDGSAHHGEVDPAVRAISRSWEVMLLVGIVTLVLGILVTAHPSTSLNVISVLIGVIVLLGGVFRLIRSLDAHEQHRALGAVIGVVMVVVGIILIRHLHLSRLLVALVVGLVFIVQGVVDLLVGFSGQSREGRAWPVVIGIVSLVAGIVVLAVPESSVTVLAVLVGIWFIVLGLLQIVGAFILRSALKDAVSD
jgi:uncharacterized membrane protein HdeD (DUF308 family)